MGVAYKQPGPHLSVETIRIYDGADHGSVQTANKDCTDNGMILFALFLVFDIKTPAWQQVFPYPSKLLGRYQQFLGS